MRRNALLGAAIGAVLIGLAVFLLLDRGKTAPAIDARSEIERSSQLSEGVSHHAVDSREALATRSLKPRAFVESGDPLLDAEPLRVLVVDSETGSPVPGAEVAWRDSRQDRPRLTGYLAAVPPPLLADFDGQANRTTADSRGLALISTCERLHVAARKDDRFGLSRFETAPHGEIRIAVVAGPFVAARVTRPDGSPVAGVQVTFGIVSRKDRNMWSSGAMGISRSPDGLAVASHPAIMNDRFQGSLIEASASVYGFGTGSRPKLSIDELKKGPLQVVVPDSIHLFVKLLDPEGLPIKEDATLTLTFRGDAAKPSGFLRADAPNGVADFPTVPTGVTMKISAQADLFDSVYDQPIETSAQKDGTLVAFVRFARRRAILVGRAIDESGAAIAGRRLSIEVAEPGGSALEQSAILVDTGKDGGFRFPVDRELLRYHERAAGLEFEIREGVVVERSAAIAPPELSAEAEASLGEVRFRHPPALASGIVVDELGSPLEGALVIAEQVRRTCPGTSFRPGARRLPSELLRTRTDARGRFEISQAAGPRDCTITSFDLEVEIDGYLCQEPLRNLLLNADDLKIVLQGAGTIEGRIMLREGAPVHRLALVVARTSGDRQAEQHSDCVDSDGRFTVTGILPAEVTVAVFLKGNPDELAETKGVTIRRHEITRIPAIDLREHPALRR